MEILRRGQGGEVLCRGREWRSAQDHTAFLRLFGFSKHSIVSLLWTFVMLFSPFVTFCQTLFVELMFPFEPAPLYTAPPDSTDGGGKRSKISGGQEQRLTHPKESRG
jgi:hypothetical protein